MSKLPIINLQGKPAGEYDIADELLTYDKGLQALQDAVVRHRANCRQGSASTLGKGEVSGSNRKLWKQKGTGRARTGLRQSPVWRGGGVVFGPKPLWLSAARSVKKSRVDRSKWWNPWRLTPPKPKPLLS